MYGYNYGFFNRIMENPGEAVVKTVKGEYGWDGWMGTFYQNDPVNHLTMIFFTQVPGEGNTRTTRRIRNLVWGELGKAIE